MLPISLNVDVKRVAVIGRGGAAMRRFDFVRESAPQGISLFVVDHDGWVCHAEAALYERLPVKADLQDIAVAFIAGLSLEESVTIASKARASGALVNVEDQPELCDFHVPATVRRGALTIAISTDGKAPGLSKILRSEIENQFGAEWAERLEVLARHRNVWKEHGLSMPEVSKLTLELVQREGWLNQGAAA